MLKMLFFLAALLFASSQVCLGAVLRYDLWLDHCKVYPATKVNESAVSGGE